jgi:hypothetical protein
MSAAILNRVPVARILDTVKMAQSVLSASNPRAERNVSSIENARNAVIDFLKKMPDVKQVNVTKLVQIDAEKGTWEAEADVYLPNATIKALGLPVLKEVLDCQLYLLRLDGQLNVVAYGDRELVNQTGEKNES